MKNNIRKYRKKQKHNEYIDNLKYDTVKLSRRYETQIQIKISRNGQQFLQTLQI